MLDVLDQAAPLIVVERRIFFGQQPFHQDLELVFQALRGEALHHPQINPLQQFLVNTGFQVVIGLVIGRRGRLDDGLQGFGAGLD
ncbi:hypothetical protein D3C72_1817880 [compost metagenome]